MPKRIPSYRLHKPSGQAVVTLDGRDHYLGRYGTPESQAASHRLVAEWMAGFTRTPGAAETLPSVPAAAGPDDGPSINEVLRDFWRHAQKHYRHPDGTATGELGNFRDSLRPLRRLYGETPAAAFGPLKLKAVREHMIAAGLARGTINQRVGRIVHVFRWAVAGELVPASVHQGLKAVAGLQRGRTEARETAPVRPVPDDHVDAIRPHVSRQVWALVELQRLTGMRPGEAVIMRTGDLDRRGPVWIYTPGRHKNAHRGHARTICLGPRAQAVLSPWLRPGPDSYLFSPREATEERRTDRRRDRKTAMTPSQEARAAKAKRREQRRGPREHYTTMTYHHAVRAGCLLAGVPHWSPNRLRHSVATRLRREFGLDAARVVLGHTSPVVTEIYGELDAAKAVEVMGRVG